MLRLILELSSKLIDFFVSDRAKREEWKRRVAEAIRTETASSDSARAHDSYDELERRAREGRSDGRE